MRTRGRFLDKAHAKLVDLLNDQGESAVHEAATMGHFDVVTKLVTAGCPLGAKGSTAAFSLIYAAVQHGNKQLLELLDERGLMEEIGMDDPDPMAAAAREIWRGHMRMTLN